MHLFLRIREREKTSIRGGRMCQNLLGELQCLLAFGEWSEWCDSSLRADEVEDEKNHVLCIGLCADVKLLSQYITAYRNILLSSSSSEKLDANYGVLLDHL